MTNVIVSLIAGVLVRLLFIAFLVMLAIWVGLDYIGSDMNVLQFTLDATSSFQDVADILEKVK